MIHTAIDRPSLWKGAVAGLAAGLAASFVMDRFQAVVSALSDSSEGGGEPATEKAADRVARTATGRPVAPANKALAGQAMHYALGAGLGLAYGTAAEFRPEITTGKGSAFGTATAVLLDETAVPALGLGDSPLRTPPATHLYTLASHLVFGVTTESVRGVIRRALG